mmetsp:Transcript_106862/g.284334  ORF Transcript_106862/g.284334 Transcript_106862/m.284334 type:complete len:221 (+) Transcript_106862:848-1510(+)
MPSVSVPDPGSAVPRAREHRLPRGRKRCRDHRESVPDQGHLGRPVTDVPDDRGVVRGSGHHARVLGIEGGRGHLSLVPLQDAPALAGVPVPDPRQSVAGASHDRSARLQHDKDPGPVVEVALSHRLQTGQDGAVEDQPQPLTRGSPRRLPDHVLQLSYGVAQVHADVCQGRPRQSVVCLQADPPVLRASHRVGALSLGPLFGALRRIGKQEGRHDSAHLP